MGVWYSETNPEGQTLNTAHLELALYNSMLQSTLSMRLLGIDRMRGTDSG